MKRLILITLFLLIFHQIAQAQHRETAVAGIFYPADSVSLHNLLDSLFSLSPQDEIKDLNCLIVPHAAYKYSGKTAARAFSVIPENFKPERVFMIGSSHSSRFNGASLYAGGHYMSPLGKAMVDTALCKNLIKGNDFFGFHRDVHWFEHSLEVEVPFLQYKLGKDIRIVPILLGTQNTTTIRKISEALRPYFIEENLFIISTDFSHYPKHYDACKTDQKTAKAILSNSSLTFLHCIRSNRAKNLKTSACAWPAVLLMLNITEDIPNWSYDTLEYSNSAYSSGDTSRVVGYFSLAGYRNTNQNEETFSFTLDSLDKNSLLLYSRSSLKAYLDKGKFQKFPENKKSTLLKQELGLFVSLYKNDKLRGCIGTFFPDKPLCELVCEMSIAAALKDQRFKAIEANELEEIEIEISVLSPLKKIRDTSEIELGKHGIYLYKDGRSGTFLPQVYEKTKWSKEEFLGNCSESKLGLDWNAWKEADIYIYEAIIFRENINGDPRQK